MSPLIECAKSLVFVAVVMSFFLGGFGIVVACPYLYFSENEKHDIVDVEKGSMIWLIAGWILLTATSDIARSLL